MKEAVTPLLEVRNLTVRLPAERAPSGMATILEGVSFRLCPGETLAIVGESGCGKSMLCRSILGLLPQGAEQDEAGQILFAGKDLALASPKKLKQIRGKEMAVILQDPRTSLNPLMRVGALVSEPLRYHLKMGRRAARHRAMELLASVGLPHPAEAVTAYPHQLSGGMRQRVAIAMALACEPKLLIADEPTTALDTTVQNEILRLLERIRLERNMGIILVTHDLGIVAEQAQQTAVMYAGKIVEQGTTAELFANMRMPYTRALLDALPRLEDPPQSRLNAIAGQPPDLARPQRGCDFAPRCFKESAICRDYSPFLERDRNSPGHRFACWHPLEGGAR